MMGGGGGVGETAPGQLPTGELQPLPVELLPACCPSPQVGSLGQQVESVHVGTGYLGID